MYLKEHLGEFLRRRRELLSPLEIGLPARARRRTPGLRRGEVADLAHMSTRYYERLEQGSGPQPSTGVLAQLAQALRLSVDERDHLYLLAGHASPVKAGTEERLDPGLDYVLGAVDGDTPGFLIDDLGFVLAQNRLNVGLFGQVAGRPSYASNIIWLWFTMPAWRDRLEHRAQHDRTGLAQVAHLRAAAAQRAHDETSTKLVGALHEVSAEFTGLWNRGAVSTTYCLPKQVHHERAGRLEFECSVVSSPASRRWLLLLRPAAGTRQRLGSLATHS